MRNKALYKSTFTFTFSTVAGALVVAACLKEDYQERNRDFADRLSVAAQAERELKAVHEVSDADELPTVRGRLWRGFENPHSSTWALVFYYVTGFFIAVSVLTNIVETVSCGVDDPTSADGRSLSCGEQFDVELFCLDTACVIIFTVEYIIRLYAAPDRFRQEPPTHDQSVVAQVYSAFHPSGVGK